MSSSKPGSGGTYDDSFDAALTPIDSDQDESAAAADTEADAAAAALRMDMLGPGGDGAPLEAPGRSLVGSQNVLLLMVVLAAGGALFAMRFLGMGPRSSIADIVFNIPKYDVKGPRDSGRGDHTKWIAELSASRIVSQVPSDQVQRNPFAMAGVIEVEKAQPMPVATETPEEREARLKVEREKKEREQRAAQIQSTLGTLVVNSVMVGGPVPVARINGEIARIGETVAEFFVVKDIHGRGVVLEADGKTYPLDVPEAHGSGPSTRRPGSSPPPRK